jgi:hypothetical protein
VPAARTLVGGGVVLGALVVHTALQFHKQAAAVRPGVTGIPSPK